MYGLSEAQSGQIKVQITRNQISLAIALAASLHAATIILTTFEFSVAVQPVDTIYLKLVANGDGVAISASEPTLNLSRSITPPTIVSQARPSVDLFTGELIAKLEEVTDQNTLVVKEIWSNNIRVPNQLTEIILPKNTSERNAIEFTPLGKTKLISAFTPPTDDVAVLPTPPILSVMSSPQATMKQTSKQKPTNSIQARLIEPARLNGPAPAPNSSRPSWVEAHVPSTHTLPFLTKHPLNTGSISMPLKVIPAMMFLKGSTVLPASIIHVEEQKRIVAMEATTELAAYQHQVSETIAEPFHMSKTILELGGTPSKTPKPEKVPPTELPPDPLVSVFRKIAELEENQKARDMSQAVDPQTIAHSEDKITIKARSVEGADGEPLDSDVANLINSQIIANWRLPPGLTDLDLQPAFFRVLLDRTGSVILIQYLGELEGTNDTYRAFSESAYRAVSETAIFIGLPPNDFDKWRELRLKFHLGS